jgi:site-specific DNA recombinase
MKMAAIYARVSSEQQREEHTIASQTAALIEFARDHDLEVPKEWIFEDEGYSGATLERPGLERVRDLAAEGHIQVVLAYAPDRLSRKYAYQILLIEEFARQGVETLFVKAPQSASAEDQLLVQFQGMIAEYERAQILERSRRGKRHRARSGEVSVLSGAPYGYRYMRKTDEAPASYVVIEAEARVVQRIYEMYTVEGLSMGEIARRLNAEGIPTRKRSARWERSVVWAMLRNPAYRGAACFGKTRVADRIRLTRALRRRGGVVSSNSTGHERTREQWIEIPVPALVSEERFARAQELLHENKIRSRRRTITPSVVQGLVSCQKCGYAFSRTSTYTSARKLHYYKCIGSDGWRKLGGPVCDNRAVRQDLLDQIVWTEVVRLLEDPTLIQQELDRRLAVARSSDPTKKREQSLQRELTRVGKGIERLLNAYQEELFSLEQLRERMPLLRQREHALRAELQAIADQAADRVTFLRLAETLAAFLGRLRSAADTLDVIERQRIVRLVVKEILIGDDTIVIRHCIPVGLAPPPESGPPTPARPHGASGGRSYLLRSGSKRPALRRALEAFAVNPVRKDARLQVAPDQPQHPLVRDPLGQPVHQDVVVDAVEELLQIHVHHHPMASLHVPLRRQHRLMRISPRPKTVAMCAEARVDEWLQHLQQRLLDQSVHHSRYPQLAHPTTRFRDVHPAHRIGPVAAFEHPSANVRPRALQILGRVLHRASVDAGTALVGFDALPRRHHVLSGKRPLKQVTRPTARLPIPRQRCFIAHGLGGGLTASGHRAPRSPGLLMRCIAKRHGSRLSFSFGPSPGDPGYYGLC